MTVRQMIEHLERCKDKNAHVKAVAGVADEERECAIKSVESSPSGVRIFLDLP